MNSLFTEQLKTFEDRFGKEWNYRHVVNADIIKSFLTTCQSQWSTHMRKVLEGMKIKDMRGDIGYDKYNQAIDDIISFLESK